MTLKVIDIELKIRRLFDKSDTLSCEYCQQGFRDWLFGYFQDLFFVHFYADPNQTVTTIPIFTDMSIWDIVTDSL
jgi:hypothetical protein